jgi:hypothetical protein
MGAGFDFDGMSVSGLDASLLLVPGFDIIRFFDPIRCFCQDFITYTLNIFWHSASLLCIGRATFKNLFLVLTSLKHFVESMMKKYCRSNSALLT